MRGPQPIAMKAVVAPLAPPGTGKTHVAVALAIAACQRGFSIYFTTLDDLVQQLKTAHHRNQPQPKLKTYLKAALLVIDEVGCLRLNRVEAHYLFHLICRRYERGSMIVTSNKAFSAWADLLGDEVLAAAILDRLLHHASVQSGCFRHAMDSTGELS